MERKDEKERCRAAAEGKCATLAVWPKMSSIEKKEEEENLCGCYEAIGIITARSVLRRCRPHAKTYMKPKYTAT